MVVMDDSSTTPEDVNLSGLYPRETPVRLGDMVLTLGQALDMETAFCPADQPRRQDPGKRNVYLARILAAAGSLEPKHAYLLPEDAED